ncbi:MAG: hypothetical protein LBG43_04055 [Treponema sp.]|jgi:hypothetical protein|nr:hypothetical protein [Treponema sp.]
MEKNDTLKETHDYVEKMDTLPRQEVLRYVRGVYDGVQSVKRQFGLDKGPPKRTA